MLLLLIALSSLLENSNEQNYNIFHLGNESGTGNESTPTPQRTANVNYPITKYGIITIAGCAGFGVLITIIAVVAYRKKVEVGLNNDPLLPAK